MHQITAIDCILVHLFGANVYAIGGSVRDALINQSHGTTLKSKDQDFLVTNTPLEAITERLLSAGARIDAVGASFAVLKVTMDGQTVDLAIPRRESSTGSGHRDFAVDFSPEVSLEDDQRRRDFTMNAISRRLIDDELVALPGALEDLRDGVIRAISEQSFLDDPLRMLRAVQFASRFNFTIEPQTRSLIVQHAHLLSTVCAERINEELQKLLLKSRVPSVGIRLLVELGLMPFVMPELLDTISVEQNVFHAFDVFGHLCAALDAAAADGGDLIDRLAALLHDIGKPATAVTRADGLGNTFFGHEDVGADMVRPILGRLRFSHEVIEAVESLVRNHMFACAGSDGAPLSDAAVRRLTRRIGPSLVSRQFALREADMRGSGTNRGARREAVEALRARIDQLLCEKTALDVSALAINGRDVIEAMRAIGAAPAGFCGDRRVGVILNALLEHVLDHPVDNTRDFLLAHIDRRLAAGSA